MKKHHPHGARELPSVTVDGYSLQLRDKDGFIGDQASQTAFRQLLERWRQRRRRKGKDPLGGVHSKDLSKSELDAALGESKTSEAADVVHGVIEEFAEELAWVIDRFMRQPSWKGVQRIVIGGGFPGSDVGERAVLQAAAVLQHMKVSVELARICHEPDDGGLLGWVHLLPPPMRKGHDAILALDIGGTNVRCGIVGDDDKVCAKAPAHHVSTYSTDRPAAGPRWWSMRRLISMTRSMKWGFVWMSTDRGRGMSMS